jgi:hypothetical protein
LTTGIFSLPAISGTSTGHKASSTYVGNGWWRCSVTHYANNTDNAIVAQAFISNTFATNPTYSGVLNNGIYLWGAQVEDSPYLGAYVKTVDTANVVATTSTTVRYESNVVNISANTLTLNTLPHLITSNSTNTTYIVYPSYENVSYSLVRTQ